MENLISKSYDGLHELVYKDSNHSYLLDGEKVPSVSTFLKGGLPTSEGLVIWKIGQAVEYSVNNYAKFKDKEKLKLVSKSSWKQDSEDAAGIGTIVHDYAHASSLGELKKADKELKKHEGSEFWDQILNATSKVDQFHEKHRGEVVLAEALCASPFYKYAGRFDVFVKDGADYVVRDYKTSKRFYPDQFMQCAMYAQAIEEWYGYKTTAYEIVRFGKDDGDVDVLRVDNKTEMESFTQAGLNALYSFGIMKEYNRDIRFKAKK
jgi:hypothetical protein